MTETPKCPMGHEMELIEVATGGWRYACKKCATSYKAGKKAASGWLSPIRSRKDLAFEAAMMLAAEPENHPLTLEEVQAHCEEGIGATPLWVEFRNNQDISRWMVVSVPDMVFSGGTIQTHMIAYGHKYNVMWRCWPRKPTSEQMAAEQ